MFVYLLFKINTFWIIPGLEDYFYRSMILFFFFYLYAPRWLSDNDDLWRSGFILFHSFLSKLLRLERFVNNINDFCLCLHGHVQKWRSIVVSLWIINLIVVIRGCAKDGQHMLTSRWTSAEWREMVVLGTFRLFLFLRVKVLVCLPDPLARYFLKLLFKTFYPVGSDMAR